MSINLEMNFLNDEGKNKKLTIRKPVVGLTDAEVLPVMETIVASDIFDKDGLDPYADPKSARYVRTAVDEIYAAEEA